MKWPFENDTNNIVKKISNRNIKSSKTRNIFILITVILSSALLSAILLWELGIKQNDINIIKDTAQIVCHNISEEQGRKLYEKNEIEWIGKTILGPSEQINNSKVNFNYGNKELLASQQISFDGKIPEKQNEIMLSKAFLEKLGYKDFKLGQSIDLTFSDKSKHKFRLVGIWKSDYESKGSYLALVSESYLNTLAGHKMPIDYYIGLKNASSMSEDEATEYSNLLLKELNLSDEQIIVRSDYFIKLNNFDMGADLIFYALVSILTLLGAGIVIYSIFYISIASNIRSYGQLRTIGTTKKQIKKIVYREGRILSILGTIIGLIIGNIVGYILIPNGWNLVTTIIVDIVTALFTILIVRISIRKPVKKAAEISAIEAASYNTYKKASKELHRKITPFSLAKMNLGRNKSKTILTILSLSIGGILLITVATVLISHDTNLEVRTKSFPIGEFNIELDSNQSWGKSNNSLLSLQEKNLFDDDFLEQINSIDGVRGTKRWYFTDAKAYVNNKDYVNFIQGFNRDEQINLEKSLLEGTVDYDTLVKNNGIVILKDRLENIYGFKKNLGDTIRVDYDTGSKIVTKEYKVMGVVYDYNYPGMKKCFAIPKKLLEDAIPVDYTSILSVIVDKEKYNSVELDLRGLVSKNSNLELNTFNEKVSYLNSIDQITYGAMLFVAFIIFCFSIINLINTTITNFLARRQEFGILEAIGLTHKQLLKMLLYENLIYSLTSSFITILLGGGLGLLTINIIKTMNPYFSFKFPWLILLGYLLCILVIQIILNIFTTKSLSKNSLVSNINIVS